MQRVKIRGIKAPNSAILAENIIKNGADDGLILTLSPGSEKGLEDVATKYGLKMEVQKLEGEVVVRMTAKDVETLDVTGETCPGPIIIVGDKLDSMEVGERLKVKSSKAETIEDISVSIPGMGGKVVAAGEENSKRYILIEKVPKTESLTDKSSVSMKRDKVLVVQSNGIGNAEKAYATFIFSKAALSMGKEVTVFLLMDGVSIAKDGNAKTVKHPAFNRLDVLMREAVDAGAKVYVCELSAEFRGMKQEDLVDGAKLAGAATYITLLSDPTYAVVNF
ncbi:DsrE family protein [Methanobacterium aggregans]|uniref:DsrE family protein n=1 Tax=Methanobacterium aggregans TaxID=1615586 RepID=UPI001AE5F90C|nr:DsrE family protein [Methanobacterium aggregans]MBP2045708.1 putative peroxiredoxin/TusA-related sulfurtransferase [Methanobacterium aggregans]